jgi:hypothetical protein
MTPDEGITFVPEDGIRFVDDGGPDPPSSEPPYPARPKRVTLRRLMALIVVLAACFAWVRPAVAPMFVVPLLIACGPSGLSWRTIETGAVIGWLIGAAGAFSALRPDFVDTILLFWTGVFLGVSWVSRFFAEVFRKPRRRPRLSLAITPLAGLIGFLMLISDADFDLRLHLSEPSLLAAARSLPPGSQKTLTPRRFGLLWAKGAEEHGGSVFWFLPGGFLDSGGLAYVPAGPPPRTWASGVIFRHLRGPWWEFVIPF